MLWDRDELKQIRLGEMCEEVYSHLYTMFSGDDLADYQTALPDLPQGLKPWLREIAPDYARKGGAPKKK